MIESDPPIAANISAVMCSRSSALTSAPLSRTTCAFVRTMRTGSCSAYIDDGSVITVGRDEKRRPSIGIGLFDAGPVVEEDLQECRSSFCRPEAGQLHLYEISGSMACCIVNRSSPVALGIHVCPVLQEQLHIIDRTKRFPLPLNVPLICRRIPRRT